MKCKILSTRRIKTILKSNKEWGEFNQISTEGLEYLDELFDTLLKRILGKAMELKGSLNPERLKEKHIIFASAYFIKLKKQINEEGKAYFCREEEK